MGILKILDSFKNRFCNHFVNWAENIVNRKVKILYPTNDNEIIKIINSARIKDLTIRVVGSGHSIGPLVVDHNESKVIVVSLEKYHLVDDIFINHDDRTVRVNAGFKLGTLYDELNKYNYLLPTQPASSAFSIGGICSIPVHGSRLAGGIISDYITAMTLIDGDGYQISKTDHDSDFDLYRVGYGLLGIITSITLRVIKVNDLHAKTTAIHNIFFDNTAKVNKKIIDNYFMQTIMASINSGLLPEYSHSFLDFHNNTLLTIDWKDSDTEFITPNVHPDITKIYNIKSSEILLGDIHRTYRTDKKLLNLGGKAARHSIIHSIEKNMEEDRDMFWVDKAERCYFMSYFIPVYDETIGFQLDHFYRAIEIVMELVKKSENNFNIDLPSDIRFVTSSQKSFFSPIYNKNKIIYAALDLVCTAYNLETSSKNDTLNTNFRKFFQEVEEKWKELGGIPHVGKMFGFNGEEIFSDDSIRNLLSDKTKEMLKQKSHKLFMNKFTQTLLSPGSNKN